MRIRRRLQLSLVVAFTFSASAAGKCPTGSLTVHGRIENLPSGVAPEVAVVLETPKGNVSKTGPISANGEFTVEASFPTLSSSFLGGDRCHNVPTVVEVRVVAGGRVYAQKSIPFKDGFEMYSPSLYRLKQDRSLFIDVLKESPPKSQATHLSGASPLANFSHTPSSTTRWGTGVPGLILSP